MRVQFCLLAAGQSLRFHGVKQLALCDGQPMVLSTLEKYQAFYPDVAIVLGANGEKITKWIPAPVTIWMNPDWQSGMSSSIRVAVESLSDKVSHLYLGLADQVAIGPEQIRLLLGQVRDNPDKIIAANYTDHLGVPAIFPRSYFAELASLRGDKGARAMLQQYRRDLVSVDLPQAAIDIDTREDLQKWQQGGTK